MVSTQYCPEIVAREVPVGTDIVCDRVYVVLTPENVRTPFAIVLVDPVQPVEAAKAPFNKFAAVLGLHVAGAVYTMLSVAVPAAMFIAVTETVIPTTTCDCETDIAFNQFVFPAYELEVAEVRKVWTLMPSKDDVGMFAS